jgi:hypothetical protein
VWKTSRRGAGRVSSKGIEMEEGVCEYVSVAIKPKKKIGEEDALERGNLERERSMYTYP